MDVLSKLKTCISVAENEGCISDTEGTELLDVVNKIATLRIVQKLFNIQPSKDTCIIADNFVLNGVHDEMIVIQGTNIASCTSKWIDHDGTILCRECNDSCYLLRKEGKCPNCVLRDVNEHTDVFEKYMKAVTLQLPFGKHRGKSLEQLLNDPANAKYLKWLLGKPLYGELKDNLQFIAFDIVNAVEYYETINERKDNYLSSETYSGENYGYGHWDDYPEYF